jgi:hypothetical protein
MRVWMKQDHAQNRLIQSQMLNAGRHVSDLGGDHLGAQLVRPKSSQLGHVRHVECALLSASIQSK